MKSQITQEYKAMFNLEYVFFNLENLVQIINRMPEKTNSIQKQIIYRIIEENIFEIALSIKIQLHNQQTKSMILASNKIFNHLLNYTTQRQNHPIIMRIQHLPGHTIKHSIKIEKAKILSIKKYLKFLIN